MSSTRQLTHQCFLLALILSLSWSLFSAPEVDAQTPVVLLRMTDTVVAPGSNDIQLSVRLDNYIDEISGFDMKFRIERTDLITFNLDVDSINTLSSGWEYFIVQFSDTLYHELRVTGVADLFAAPITPPIDPQQGGVLFRLSVNAQIPPSSETDRNAEIIFVHENPPDLILSTDMGNRAIGMHQQVLDTTEVVLVHGAVTLLPSCCINSRGNANNDPLDQTNISDITYLTNYLFGIPNGPAPVCNEEANVNGDSLEQVNISDLTYLIAYLFQVPSGPPPPTCP